MPLDPKCLSLERVALPGSGWALYIKKKKSAGWYWYGPAGSRAITMGSFLAAREMYEVAVADPACESAVLVEMKTVAGFNKGGPDLHEEEGKEKEGNLVPLLQQVAADGQVPGEVSGLRGDSHVVAQGAGIGRATHWSDVFHEHTCPQCFRKWECGRVKCKGAPERFCPYGPLCHVGVDGEWTVTPKYIRKLADRGIGSLFDRRGIPRGPDDAKEE